MGDLISIFGQNGFELPPEIAPASPETQLLEAMAEHGLSCNEAHLDGKLHRFGKDRTSWYAAHADNVPAGSFGDWKLGLRENWVADVGREITEEERLATLLAIERAQEARKLAEREKHERAASTADTIWQNAPGATDHDYLGTKGIGPGVARMGEDGRLILPLYDQEGNVRSVQFISATGAKRFLTGGQVSGCFGFMGKMSGAKSCYIAEGFATASTIHRATGAPVFWSYSAQNMPPVAEYVASLGVPLTIVADNDESGTGQRYANKAAKLTGAPVIMPEAGDVNDYALSGGNVAQLLGHSDDAWLVPFDDFIREPMPIKWLVKHWLPQGALAMVHGPSGIGKTFFVLDMALSVATGKDWDGHGTKAKPVAYLAGEGHAGLAMRLKGWSLRYGVTKAPFWVSKGGTKLDKPDGFNHAASAIRALPEPPGLIVVDTLHRFLAGDENSSQEAGLMIEACDRLRVEFGATVLLVHHTGNNGEAQHRARGSSAWKGALEVEVGISKLDDGEVIVAKNHKQKDAEETKDAFGTLSDILLPWYDEDGEQVKTATWSPAQAQAPDPTKDHQESIAIFERAWWDANAEDRDGSPYLSASAFRYWMERNSYSKARADKALGTKGLIGALAKADIIAAHEHGWIVAHETTANRLMLSKSAR